MQYSICLSDSTAQKLQAELEPYAGRVGAFARQWVERIARLSPRDRATVWAMIDQMATQPDEPTATAPVGVSDSLLAKGRRTLARDAQ